MMTTTSHLLFEYIAGADPGFQVRGGALKKIVGVFCVKNHDFMPKNHIFPILGEAREIFGVFHVKNHVFTPKKSYFFQF
jgi:hypothetical protein